MPQYIYMGVTALIGVYFLYSFLRRRQMYELLLVIWIPVSWLPLLVGNKTFTVIMGVIQVLLFVIFIFFLFRPDKKPIMSANVTEIEAVPAEGIIDDIETKEVLEEEENEEAGKE